MPNETTDMGDSVLITPIVMDSVEVLERIIAEMKAFAAANPMTEAQAQECSNDPGLVSTEEFGCGVFRSRGYSKTLARYQRHIAMKSDLIIQLQLNRIVDQDCHNVAEQLTIQAVEREDLDRELVRSIVSLFWVEPHERKNTFLVKGTPPHVVILLRQVRGGS